MAGSLIKLSEVSVSSDQSSVTLGASEWDSSYNVYQVVFSGVESDDSSTNRFLRMRVLTGGSAQDDSNYDYSHLGLKSSGSYQDLGDTNEEFFFITGASQNGVEASGKENCNGFLYLYQFNNSSAFSHFTQSTAALNADATLFGAQGGGVKTTNEANNGVEFSFDGGNIRAGNFRLYAIKN
tara:strand:+ start:1107 stop:1649 length:543 start_codon:yes stop_codon:yes gene_type:complete